jgi:hypothetical protein
MFCRAFTITIGPTIRSYTTRSRMIKTQRASFKDLQCLVKLVKSARCLDSVDTRWGKSSEERPDGEGGGAGGEKLKDKRQNRTNRKDKGFQR